MRPAVWDCSGTAEPAIRRSAQGGRQAGWHGWLPMLLLAVGLSLRPAHGAATAPAASEISTALFLASESALPPPESAGWHLQALPDEWQADHPGVGGAWYRLRFDVPTPPSHPWAILLPRVGGIAQVYLNGTLIGRTSGFDGGEVSLWRRASTFSLPPVLLQQGRNLIDLKVSHTPMFGIALEPVMIGDDMAVDAAFNGLLHWRVSLSDATRILYVLLGGFTLVLWMHGRQESMYGYFGLLPIATAISLSPPTLPPLPDLLWTPIYSFAVAAITPLSFIYCLRYAGWRWPRVELAWWLFTLLLALAWCLHQDGPYWGWLHYLWLVQIPATLASLVLIAVIAWRTPNRETLLLLAGHLFSSATAGYTWISSLLQPRSTFNLLPIHLTPLCLFITWILTNRFAQTVNRYEALNAELEARVAAKHAELAGNDARMRELERERAVADERGRIMRDMHDGIGGQLISTLSLIEHGSAPPAEIASAVRECIDELRLAIDSLEPVEHELLPVLGSFRQRLEGRLHRQGIRLEWKVGDVPPLRCLTPQNVLHVLRILQEAFTNTLKHAQATRISVETGVSGDGGQVYIRVQDDGRGFTVAGRGRGIANMRRRAEIVGGAIDIQGSPEGTLLCLQLPV